MTTPAPKRKLIEVALPLEKINAESAREKSIRHGHPSTLHLWWARRPLAACRAVLFAQLVDDPSSHPEQFPTDDAVTAERARLHQLIERLVMWENTRDEELLAQARAEIMRSCDGAPPAILDPFAGGGSIPLEAQRLGLEAHASDLNPVAVLINKALIEIPPKFAGHAPVHPDATDAAAMAWPRATGMAEDVRRYGQWMRDEADKRIGHLYPKATLPDGTTATVIAWIWARTVTCPNPACAIAMPLVRSWWLGKKKGKETYIIPDVAGGTVTYRIGHDTAHAPTPDTDGTIGRTGATCIGCGTGVDLKYVRAEGQAGKLGTQLMATVAEGKRTRIYLAPTPAHEAAANIEKPDGIPTQPLPKNPRDFKTPNYGMTEFADLFTARQLTALTTFSDLVTEARGRVHADALAAGMPDSDRLTDGGTGAAAYADAITTYLGFAVSRLADIANSLCQWEKTKEQIRHLFSRQAIPMVWDFPETTPFGTAAGSYMTSLGSLVKTIDTSGPIPGRCDQRSATDLPEGVLISTDPPYYDNIGYSDLSDFFYVWLRRSLREVHPDVLSTVLVPKAEELVANPYRHDGKAGAQDFFESGFREVFRRARAHVSADFPITVYYAFKQSESMTGGESSTGWETLLEGMIRGGWAITATWPVRSEASNRMLAQGTNALASSIVLALRPRPDDADRIDRRRFLAVLKSELPGALKELQQGRIAPVDLPQAAIGPGIAVFSRYAQVLNDDGTPMSVRAALQAVNRILDEVVAEQEGDFDSATRFAVAWFRQHGFATASYGDADSLARARGVDVARLQRAGIVTAGGGKVTLLGPAVIGEQYGEKGWDPHADTDISLWEIVIHLAAALGEGGIAAAGQLLARIRSAPVAGHLDLDTAKEVGYLLFSVAEDRKESATAIPFNALVTSWTDILSAARTGVVEDALF